jgi:hypothetical protein
VFFVFFFAWPFRCEIKWKRKEKRVARTQRENTSSGGNSCELLIRLIAFYIYRENGYGGPSFFFRPVHPSIHFNSRVCVMCVVLSCFLFSFCQFWSSSNWNDSSSNTHTPNCFFFFFLYYPILITSCVHYITHTLYVDDGLCVCVCEREEERSSEGEREKCEIQGA